MGGGGGVRVFRGEGGGISVVRVREISHGQSARISVVSV